MQAPDKPTPSTSRRDFLKTSAAVVVGGVVAAPFILSSRAGAAVNSETLKIGLIGCGGRGSGAANQALNADKNVALTAVADAFEDRLNVGLQSLQKEHGDRVQVPADRRFFGLARYGKGIERGGE